MVETIDCSGFECPRPLMQTIAAMRAHEAGVTIRVIVDNTTSVRNIQRYLTGLSIDASANYEADRFEITFVNPSHREEQLPREQLTEEVLQKGGDEPAHDETVLLFSSNRLGRGEDELGRLLCASFLSTIEEWKRLPAEIILINSAVRMAKKGTPTAETLKALAEKGVFINLCGLCVDFFKIESELAVGEISNMLYIAERLSTATRLIQF